MEKVEIIQKDCKNHIDDEEILLEIKYGFLGRCIALLLRIFGIYIGIFFLMAFQSYIVKIIAIFCIVFCILDFLNILFFRKLFFCTNYVLKESILKKSYLNYSIAEVMVSKGYFGGTLMFWKKHQRIKTILNFNFDLLPITNQEFKRIKQILIDKKVIKGDEYEWNI